MIAWTPAWAGDGGVAAPRGPPRSSYSPCNFNAPCDESLNERCDISKYCVKGDCRDIRGDQRCHRDCSQESCAPSEECREVRQAVEGDQVETRQLCFRKRR
ncbi:MAG TPA: hypothetical protein VH208_03285 [Myxococcaceae bacterium]|nr:hypothetical protein [Myxococcaceae bacterium]